MPAVTSAIRLLCVDDHRVVLDGLGLLLGRQRDMALVATASTGEEAVRLFKQHRPDVTLMDLQLPGMSGLEAIRQIRFEDPFARIVVLTVYRGDEDIYRALRAGAVTYVLKNALASELVDVVRDVHKGSRPIPEDVRELLAVRETSPHLTQREIDVVHLIAKGMRNKEIAMTLGISKETAKVHVKNILSKLKVNDRAAVIAIAVRRGLIHIE